MAGKREYRSGRRSAPPQLRIGHILLAFLEAASRLLSGDWDSSSFSPTYSPERHSPSRAKLPVSWRKSMKRALSEPLASESDEWSEHRVGLIISGQKAGRYFAIQPSEHDGWDIQISRRRSSRGTSDANQSITEARVQTLLVEWDARWLPVGIYADAVTQRFFRKAMRVEDDL